MNKIIEQLANSLPFPANYLIFKMSAVVVLQQIKNNYKNFSGTVTLQITLSIGNFDKNIQENKAICKVTAFPSKLLQFLK